jgi:hypothetical protein
MSNGATGATRRSSAEATPGPPVADQQNLVRVDGDPDVRGRLVALLDEPDPDFAIVTP